MKYVALIGTEGAAPPDALAVMQRDLPGWIEEMDGRGVRLLGRELDFPETAATSPVAQFHPFEIRPFQEGLRLGSGAPAFGRATTRRGSRIC